MAYRPQEGTYGVDFGQEEAIKLATALQLQLTQKETDVIDQLANDDYQGDFEVIGDTVKVVALDPNSIKIQEFRGTKDDIRPKLDTVAFEQNTMTIDSERKWGFKVKDLQRIENQWNIESALHDQAGYKMRQATQLSILNDILECDQIATIGTPANPIDLETLGLSAGEISAGKKNDVANMMFRLTNKMKGYLEETGAINGGTYPVGANKQTPYRGTPSLFLSPVLYRELLNAQTVRVDDVMEDVIKNGKYEKFNGLLLNQCMFLDKAGHDHVAILDAGATDANCAIMILGTKNTVTRANKVLKPEKFRDHYEFADVYNGREIFGQMVASAKSCVIAFVKVNDVFGDVFHAGAAFDPTKALYGVYTQESSIATDADINNMVYPDRFPATAGDITGLATVATTGAYGDLSGTPTLGTAASHAATDFATPLEVENAVTLGIAGHRHDEGTLAADLTDGSIDGLTGPGEAVQQEPAPENPETQGEG